MQRSCETQRVAGSLKQILLLMVCVFVLLATGPTKIYAKDGSLDAGKISALQTRFPHGKYWNHLCTDVSTTRGDQYQNTVTSVPCSHQERVGAYDCNHFDGTGQCWGFARKMAYEYFGVYFSSQPKSKNINDLKAGDVVRYHPGSVDHSIWVTGVSGDTVTFAECNFSGPCQITWGKTTTKAAIARTLVHIEQAPEDLATVTIQTDIPLLYVGQTNTFLYTVSKNAEKAQVKWKADPDSVLLVNNNGDIKGRKAGTAKVTAYIADDKGKVISSDSRTVTVKAPTIKITRSSVTIYPGQSIQLNAQVEGPDTTVTWKLVKPPQLPLSLSRSGKLQLRANKENGMLGSYTAEVQAKANGKTAKCKVTINPASLKLNATRVSLVKGKTKQLTAQVKGASKKVAWKSSKPSVAAVSSSGKITAKKYGTATISARANGITKTCKVTVSPSIKLNKKSASVAKGKTVQLKAVVNGPSKKVTWKSSNPSIASVSSSGKVTAKKPGKVKIKATANKKTATCTITVTKPAIKLNKTSLTLKKGSTAALKATVNGTSKKVTWSSSNKSIATVSGSGRVTGKKAGTVTITAKANGVSAKCKVKVTNVGKRDLYQFLGQDYKTFASSLGIDFRDVYDLPAGVYKVIRNGVEFSVDSTGSDSDLLEAIATSDGNAYTVLGISAGMRPSQAKAILAGKGWKEYEGIYKGYTGFVEYTKDNHRVVYFVYSYDRSKIKAIGCYIW